MLRFVLLLIFALAAPQTVLAKVAWIADGDCAGLQAAVTAASSQPTQVQLARGGIYVSSSTAACGINLNSGNLTLEGNGATLIAEETCGVGTTIQMGSGASLAIRNLQFKDQTDTCQTPPSTRISNDGGTLSLENVTVVGNGLSRTTFFNLTVGKATLRNTTWIKAGLWGDIDVYNSTFVDSSLEGGPCFAHGSLCLTFIKLTNSLVSNASVCDEVSSLGGNVISDSSCGFFASTSDKVVSGLTLPAAADHGGLVPTVQIGYGNPAYRAGVAQYCEATDARGVTRNASNCDVGAYESGGGLGLVTENGMNGLYYVPGVSNGHYVSVQRIHDNKDVMVFWNTFNQNGEPAWIFGVGTLASDRHIHASMYRNLGGVLQPGGAPTGAQPSEWGTVDIDVTSCSAAQFNYQSSLPEFGSGQFPLTRLAFESAINCGD
ncbi:choice-of-anchor Q domain-containing protein [Rudaea sp.]|uniref:choice-of-anchor Q domain-containing protein n=1 Tax=Rudaea sp. TaxID=2136325 RepID=UPI002ED6735D